ncbi:hypothetical protein SAMN04487972_10773 [Paracoccus halophilus]|uniref:Uncharacterized protein n=1 Tax=Paracoccus halophilus TaxID=376733 RepID=A0A099F1P6_9RHOB|nr:hypothetical protein [Paracoccus halophilus]KGJ04605.1 hypothetical protein IT41_09610 [Paracoccus halophilus]SFA50035.1 hypothetical protein SAMN04487972_10773 [Paracoccus halophilus]
MTALNQYQRLEAAGLWRETPQSQARDVIVSFGDATLMLTDPRSETPLTHWSLPAVTRLNPGRMPARYGPGEAGADEELEIDDDLMIAAISRIHRAIEAARPHPGRLRGGLMLGAAALMAALAVFWVPPALVRHAANVAPPAQRSEIGRTILAEIAKTTGNPCARPAGDMVRGKLAARLTGPDSRIEIVPARLRSALRLPGAITVIGEDLIRGQITPEVTAGHILAAQAVGVQNDPLLQALRFAGPRATFQLLTNGTLPPQSLAGYGESLLAGPVPRPDDEILLNYFTRAGIASEPYARSLDPTGEATLGLIEADPFRTAEPRPVLSEREWAVLQEICDQ